MDFHLVWEKVSRFVGCPAFLDWLESASNSLDIGSTDMLGFFKQFSKKKKNVFGGVEI